MVQCAVLAYKQDLHILSFSRKLWFKEVSKAEGLEVRCSYGVLVTVKSELVKEYCEEFTWSVRILIYGMISQWTRWQRLLLVILDLKCYLLGGKSCWGLSSLVA